MNISLNAQWCFQNAFQFNFWSQQLTLCHSKGNKWDERNVLLLPSHPTAMRNDGRGGLCLELWPCEELWGPSLRLRHRGKRSTVGEMTPRQWELRAGLLQAVRLQTVQWEHQQSHFVPVDIRRVIWSQLRVSRKSNCSSDGGNASLATSTKQIESRY